MSPVSKREYLEAVFLRYKRASRQLKKIIGSDTIKSKPR